MKILYLLLILTFHSWALDNQFYFKNYKQCSASKSFIRFSSESTKFGFITTSFDGYAKDFTISTEEKGADLIDVKIVVKAKSLDTDNSSRDEKLYEQILEVEKYKTIEVTLLSKVSVLADKNKPQSIPAKILVRGETFPLTLNVRVYREDEVLKVIGNTKFSLKKFRIPDPSIAIASVRDEFDLNFEAELN